eukprot:CAMPEP_0196807932 /NCGR_PEP_ID=MMETSP1362-20130617/7912_1 /TAXON_ID=163516 /ORGANISM="Leptocylindrus danicus, Strain CCMP1856" /LENGTH=584 /DNA_ID=CAMNT_0042182051 /DNA_START=55 /DNA_END=1806 /DNA_ORIENTATION=+
MAEAEQHHASNATTVHLKHIHTGTRIPSSSSSSIAATSPPSSKQATTAPTTPMTKKTECDFVIIGHGSAGRAAKERLQQLCGPMATIIVIDPYSIPPSNNNSNNNNSDNSNNSSVQYIQGTATAIHPSLHELHYTDMSYNNTASNTADHHHTVVVYKHSCLLATGCHGAPPPTSLMDRGVLPFLLELRSTTAPTTLNGTTTKQQQQQRPALPAGMVRQIAQMAASEGARVCILGSGLDALELAASLSTNNTNTNTNNSSNKNKNGATTTAATTTLVCGTSAPLSNTLPRYLSSALIRRLRQQCSNNLVLEEQSLVRYIAAPQHGSGVGGNTMEVYTAKAYDTMDTRTHKADLIVVSPSVEDYKGNATITTTHHNTNNRNNQQHLHQHQSWSTACLDDTITCYAKDARIVVNTQLLATQGVYAAGSVARLPYTHTGRAIVAGEGRGNAADAGRFAAEQMAAEFLLLLDGGGHGKARTRTKQQHFHNNAVDHGFSFSSNFIPIWRSDQSYSNSSSTSTALRQLGVEALCVGQCDAETMATHGYWWTNRTRRKRRNTKLLPLHTSSSSTATNNAMPMVKRRNTKENT